jgi:hypothetical protein
MARPAPGQTALYKGTFDCFQKTVKNEVSNKNKKIIFFHQN